MLMHLPHRRPALAAVVSLAAAAALGACGSSSNSNSTSAPSSGTATAKSSSAGTGYYGSSGSTKTTAKTTAAAPASAASGAVTVKADASGALAFDQTTLTAKAGKVTVAMVNPSSSGIPHGIAVQGNGVDKDGKTVSPGGTSTVTLTLKPGTYSFYCPVPGHKAAGMKGTLTVR